MRLRKIKLAGFKSFVDPTTLAVPGNLVGIVGPNGCGKSNIIDAVTWVMGESSAKHLRGESLTDVIFNGSNTRQPVGQATVELVFDNSEDKLGGQYAGYSEISIKRQIDREAISTYYLNGTRCRRKDIQAIFLGTGLGPRSYAIIEQGMISRLIEAKPEELRFFIEEAAGISRYREKRRETENRMRHTRENLARLSDLREELGNQLGHLQRQSRAAEKYQELKQEERRLEAELLALNWRDLKGQSDRMSGEVRNQENRVEQGIAALREVEAAIERVREELTDAGEAHNAAQSKVYGIGGQISRLEQQLQHGEEKILTLNVDVARIQAAQQAAAEQGSADGKRLAEIEKEVRSLEPQLNGSRSAGDQAYVLLTESERTMQAWQTEWDVFQEASAGIKRQTEIETLRVQHLEESVDEAGRRHEAHARELESILPDPLEARRRALEQDVQRSDQAVAAAQKAMQQRLADLKQAREGRERSGEEFNLLRARQQEAGAELTSLETLQNAGASQDGAEIRKWLHAAGLLKAPRLVDRIKVERGWEAAVETVLDERLQDLCTRDLDAALAVIGKLNAGKLGLLAESAPGPRDSESGGSRLLDKIKGNISLLPLLRGVHAAEAVREAQKMLGSLGPGESVVTRDGVWLGKDWVRVHRAVSEEQSQLRRAGRIRELRAELQGMHDQIESEQRRHTELSARVGSLEQAGAQEQEHTRELQNAQTESRSGRAEVVARLDGMARRREQLINDVEELETQRMEDLGELEALRKRLLQSEKNQGRLARQREELIEVRDRHRSALDQARSRWQGTHEQSHGIALRLESLSSQRASIEQAMRRTSIQGDQLGARLRELQQEIRASQSPLAEHRRQLETHLAERILADKELARTRQRVQAAENGIRSQEQARSAAEMHILELRSELEAARLQAREAQVRLQTVSEQLAGLGQQPDVLLQGLEEGATLAAWRERLESVAHKIQRLGPINLAAIDEYKQLSERKEYLDRQNADLADALNTLENAIRKIDRESRTRFKETFDRLNANLKEMFPVLFGGGHAYLELTGDDLLETGVTVMARPPGKRNSSIHLLSGGEKALTAVALVFAIFKLNPAPFCILDEVDAPLDDTNTGRFSNLVTEMSKDVQFVFITHNKITMEISQQLLGVTMQEAGVSRLVSVDMDEAVRMAASA